MSIFFHNVALEIILLGEGIVVVKTKKVLSTLLAIFCY